MRFVIPSSATPSAEHPASGQQRSGETPAYLRQRRTKQRLANGGGKRMSFNVPGNVVEAIATIRQQHGLLSDTDAVVLAILRCAKAAR